ncbi:hypothetical protein LY78DRAFT_651829, partial [Colletotrichum sublineola]
MIEPVLAAHSEKTSIVRSCDTTRGHRSLEPGLPPNHPSHPTRGAVIHPYQIDITLPHPSSIVTPPCKSSITATPVNR